MISSSITERNPYWQPLTRLVHFNINACMFRLHISPVNHFLQKKIPFSNAVFLSEKHLLLSLLRLSTSPSHLLQIHARILISGLRNETFLLSEFVRFAALSPSRNLSYARSLLAQLGCSSPLPWNIVIRGYAWSDSPVETIRIFQEMRRRGIRPNKLTFPFIFKACTMLKALREGRQVHAGAIKSGLNTDLYVQNTLISFYGSCKKISDARYIFDEMCERTVVSWNTIVTACTENARLDYGLVYFERMRESKFEPDETTMVVMLSACAEIGNLSLGRWLHAQVMERGMALNCQLGTSLVDMYAKSGAVGCALLVFDRMEEKNVWTWSAIILGFAQHGYAEEALKFFSKMKSTSVCPNYITFLGVLCACSHAGLVEDGYKFFNEMKHVYKIKPMMIHYGALVDVLGRAGRLEEAYSFITNMPFEPDPIVWRTLLSACGAHDFDGIEGIRDEVRKRLIESEPRRGGNFVMVANMYAESGMWDRAEDVRRAMRCGRMKKMAGESCIELGGIVRVFFSGSDSQANCEVIYEVLDGLNMHMQMLEQ